MDYVSTRNNGQKVKSAKAIAAGLAPDGGLYTPVKIPKITASDIARFCSMSYVDRAAQILSLYLDDFNNEELLRFSKAAYGREKFDDPAVAPVVKLKTGEYLLELWHGPTAAFKDMALQLLPHLMTSSLKKIGEKREACILAATSGDTGKAALEGFSDVKGTKIIVFYPRDGVSMVQKLQMTTQKGENVGVCALNGNFDDAQTAVKSIFADSQLRERASRANLFFTSANSINWGRLAPQIVYYISAYCDLLNKNEIKYGEKINICVPTGNFGNILAAYFAKEMGLPVNRLICASNKNRVLTDFFRGGLYDTKREFYATSSPSMDILISSNLERLLYYAVNQDSSLISKMMQSLKEKGEYRIEEAVSKDIDSLYEAGSCDEQGTKDTIFSVFNESSYLCDTHTAVGIKVYRDYKKHTGDHTKTLIASTASPYKFCKSVLEALQMPVLSDGPELIGQLYDLTHTKVPKPLEALLGLSERFTKSVPKEKIKDVLIDFLKI